MSSGAVVLRKSYRETLPTVGVNLFPLHMIHLIVGTDLGRWSPVANIFSTISQFWSDSDASMIKNSPFMSLICSITSLPSFRLVARKNGIPPARHTPKMEYNILIELLMHIATHEPFCIPKVWKCFANRFEV